MINIEWIEKTAKKVMEERGSHSAQIMLMTPENKVEIGILLFKGDEEKLRMMRLIREMIQKRGIKEYFICCEAWRAIIAEKDIAKPFIRPSEHPDRKNA